MKKTDLFIDVIGTDASGLNSLSLSLKTKVIEAEQIAGSKRLLKNIGDWWRVNCEYKAIPTLIKSESISELIKKLKISQKKTVLLASGDPLWYGVGRALLENFPSEILSFHPSTTSLQLAFAKLGRCWQDTSWISLHGRDASPLFNLFQRRPAAITILTDPDKNGPSEVQRYLKASGLENIYEFWIFEQLGGTKERMKKILPEEQIKNSDFDILNLVVLIKNEAKKITEADIPYFGISDGLFHQYEDRPGLMTKREIRVQILSDLELPKEGVIWDVGAGVGSIGLEAIRLRPKLKLFCIEKRNGCQKLINKNANRLSVSPASIYQADILDILKERDKVLPPPDRVVMGGGGSLKNEMLEKIIENLKTNGIIVIPLSNLKAIDQIEAILRNKRFKINISQHQSYRGVPLGDGIRLAPMNPVFIVVGKKINPG